VSDRNGFRLQIALMVLTIMESIVMGMGAWILNDIRDRVVRLENLNLGEEKHEKSQPVLSGIPHTGIHRP
jgi:hypothetical protein